MRIDYHAPLRCLVSVRGHPFDRNAFQRVFADMAGIAPTFVDQPASGRLLKPEAMAEYDALVLYDMPGVDFAEPGLPGCVSPPSHVRNGLAELLTAGKGVVALHHALAGWPDWDDYAEWLGGRFLYRPGVVRGRVALDSGYRHDVRHAVSVLVDHPVTTGLPGAFEMTDELYLAEVFEDAVTPLLRSDYPFDCGNFHSAAAAMLGRPGTNAGWHHPPGSSLLGWVKRAINSPLVYLQPGDAAGTYDDPNYRRLVENAIRWVASPEALAWGRN